MTLDERVVREGKPIVRNSWSSSSGQSSSQIGVPPWNPNADRTGWLRYPVTRAWWALRGCQACTYPASYLWQGESRDLQDLQGLPLDEEWPIRSVGRGRTADSTLQQSCASKESNGDGLSTTERLRSSGYRSVDSAGNRSCADMSARAFGGETHCAQELRIRVGESLGS